MRPRVDIDVLRLLVADFGESLIDVLVGHLGVGVRNLDVFVLAELDLGDDLENGLEAHRLAVVEVQIGDVGRPTTFRFSASICF